MSSIDPTRAPRGGDPLPGSARGRAPGEPTTPLGAHVGVGAEPAAEAPGSSGHGPRPLGRQVGLEPGARAWTAGPGPRLRSGLGPLARARAQPLGLTMRPRGQGQTSAPCGRPAGRRRLARGRLQGPGPVA